jgi:glycosyltransferase involved in cell wall biosynthesis
MNEKRLKIYYCYSKCKVLTPTKGNFINEISNMKALSKFADVYYCGNLFNEKSFTYGMLEGGNKPEEYYPPDYDVVIVRANIKVFNRAKQYNVPTIWMSSPYNEYAFDNADIIGCFSKQWERCLREGDNIGALNPNKKEYYNALSVYQTVGDEFKPLQDNEKTIMLRKQFEGDFIIGCFGRIVKSNYPHLLLAALPRLIEAIPNIKVFFGITALDMIPKNCLINVILTKYEYKDMPYVLSACDISVISSQGLEWDFCGSLKTIKAAACGVPVICAESESRNELLGKDYPLYLPLQHFELPIYEKHINDFVQLILKYYNDRVALASIGSYVRNKSLFYSIENSAKRWEEIVNKIIR